LSGKHLSREPRDNAERAREYRFMARRTPRRNQGRNKTAIVSPNRRPVPKVVAIGGPTLALVVVGLAVAWALSPAAPARHLVEARTSLKAGFAGRAERALRAAIAADPADPEPSRLLLEVLRVEDRSFEAARTAWEALGRVAAVDRPAILRELTLALLTELPDDLTRTALTRWSAADPADVEARVALLRRVAASPRSSDPDRPARLAELTKLVADHPRSVSAREALISDLADAGELDRGRAALDAWPGVEADRDPRYWRLRGRWDLEYDHQAGRAVEAFRTVLAELPADWRTRYRLARALRQQGRTDEAVVEAESVRRTREVLDPLTLGPRLDSALGRLDDPDARRELAEICDRAGLTRLAKAWKEA
jgi:thioredoxin-like negative regulator of GroEL